MYIYTYMKYRVIPSITAIPCYGNTDILCYNGICWVINGSNELHVCTHKHTHTHTQLYAMLCTVTLRDAPSLCTIPAC
ncbi:hypothetical protein FKM82_028381 [Ascaphus truei]